MGLRQNLQNDVVSELTLREPVTASAEETVRSAVERMRERKLGCTIIVDEARKPIGMLTESMIRQLLVDRSAILDDPISQHMARQWPWVQSNDPIADVLEAMQTKNVRFLCVVDEDGRLAGLTGQKGLMEYVASHFPMQVMVQRIGGTSYVQEREGS